ncbi:hypothetical protein, partial [Actinomyces naeslundii]|uniref:hypothetical protein n=1 Tax=Actinomyces naeslundii TaxID=1655 RepID=UPI001C4C999A
VMLTRYMNPTTVTTTTTTTTRMAHHPADLPDNAVFEPAEVPLSWAGLDSLPEPSVLSESAGDACLPLSEVSRS